MNFKVRHFDFKLRKVRLRFKVRKMRTKQHYTVMNYYIYNTFTHTILLSNCVHFSCEDESAIGLYLYISTEMLKKVFYSHNRES